MDQRMMNEWLAAQSQKRQLTEADMQRKRLGVAITEQLTPKEEKFAKANRHILSEMVKRYGSDKGTQLFYSSVREQVKKLHEQDDKLYPQKYRARSEGALEPAIYTQAGYNKTPAGWRYNEVHTNEYGTPFSNVSSNNTQSITRPGPSDSPLPEPHVYSNYNQNPTTSALNPALLDRYGDAKEKEFNRLRDTFRKGQDRDDAKNVPYTQAQQNRNNEYLANKFGKQVTNSLSAKGLLNRNPSIQSNPELAGQQSAMHDWEGEMIGRRDQLRVDASRFPH